MDETIIRDKVVKYLDNWLLSLRGLHLDVTCSCLPSLLTLQGLTQAYNTTYLCVASVMTWET